MPNEIVMKKGDTLPIRELELQEKNSNGNKVGIDLTGATVRFYVYDNKEENLIIDGSQPSITDAVNGLIKYEWQEDDTKKTGVHKGEFVVTYADGEITFPNDGFIPITITDDLQDSFGGN